MPERVCFDISIGTQSVLKSWDAHFQEHGYGEPGSEVADAVTEEDLRMIASMSGRESYCGNGSLMRAVPVSLAFHAVGAERAAAYAKESSKVTHPHLRCQEACSIYTQLVVKTLRGSGKDELAQTIATSSIHDEQLREWMEQVDGNIRSTGYVIDTLEAALWALFTTTSFEEGATRVVNLGHDAGYCRSSLWWSRWRILWLRGDSGPMDASDEE